MLSQYQVLNHILSTQSFDIVINNNLNVEHFFNYKSEFNFIKNHLDTTNHIPDKTTFTAAYPDFEYIEVHEPESYLISEVLKDYKTEKLSIAFNRMKKSLENGDLQGAEDSFNESAKIFDEAHEKSVGAKSMIHNTDRYASYVERAENHDKYYTSTGFKELDQIIGGIDRKEENMVIAARTGIGKSWMLCIMAAACYKNGLKVGIYSGEMSFEKVAYRIDTMLGNAENGVRFTNTAITRGDIICKQGYNAYIKELGKVPADQHADILIFTPNDMVGPPTVDALAAYVKKYQFDVLMIDQYSLLEDLGRYQKESDRIAHISKEVKTKLQVKLGIPIISVSQNNRTGEKDDNGDVIQDTTQVYGSDRIGQDATVLLMLSRKQLDTGSELFKINIVKARDGGTGKILTYDADFNTGQFHFISEGLSKEDGAKKKQAYEPEGIPSEPLQQQYSMYEQAAPVWRRAK